MVIVVDEDQPAVDRLSLHLLDESHGVHRMELYMPQQFRRPILECCTDLLAAKQFDCRS